MVMLSETLSREVELVSSFVDTLVEEKQCLITGTIFGLEDIAAAKQLMVAELNDLETKRRQLLGEHGLSQAATEAWFSRKETEHQVNSLWRQLVAKAQEAKELHEFNGRLVDELLLKTSRALTILNASQATPALLYGKDGQATESAGQRILDSA